MRDAEDFKSYLFTDDTSEPAVSLEVKTLLNKFPIISVAPLVPGIMFIAETTAPLEFPVAFCDEFVVAPPNEETECVGDPLTDETIELEMAITSHCRRTCK